MVLAYNLLLVRSLLMSEFSARMHRKVESIHSMAQGSASNREGLGYLPFKRRFEADETYDYFGSGNGTGS